MSHWVCITSGWGKPRESLTSNQTKCSRAAENPSTHSLKIPLTTTSFSAEPGLAPPMHQTEVVIRDLISSGREKLNLPGLLERIKCSAFYLEIRFFLTRGWTWWANVRNQFLQTQFVLNCIGEVCFKMCLPVTMTYASTSVLRQPF